MLAKFSSLSLVIMVRAYTFILWTYLTMKTRHEAVTANIVASTTSVWQLVKNWKYGRWCPHAQW